MCGPTAIRCGPTISSLCPSAPDGDAVSSFVSETNWAQHYVRLGYPAMLIFEADGHLSDPLAPECVEVGALVIADAQ